MNKKILVIGATGSLGNIAANKFVEDGYSVRALVRNIKQAKKILPENIELVFGDVTKPSSVLEAVKNIDFIHISLSGGNLAKDIYDVEFKGVQNIIKAAEKSQVNHITLISGMNVNKENQSHHSEKAKLLAEQALADSDISYTIFKPGFFMETLYKFIQSNKILLLGSQSNPLRLIAANDLMSNISKCYSLEKARNKTFYVFGNESFLLKDALHMLRPKMKLHVIPLWIIKPINKFFMRGKLTRVIGIMEILQKKGEEGSPDEYFDTFGTHSTKFSQWLQDQSNDS